MTRKSGRLETAAAACVIIMAIATFGSDAVRGQGARTAASGIYTDAQARRGAAVYQGQCARCHGADLSGTPYGPGLAERELLARWRFGSVGDLFSLIQTTMPLNSPGGLTARQNADIVAFLLQSAKLPAGQTELSERVEVLSAIPMTDTGSRAAASAAPAAPAAAGITYTEEQAGRGEMLFRRHCQFCHSTNTANQKTDKEPLRGFMIGDKNIAAYPLGGRYAMKYPSVYHFYVRIRENMPAWDIQSITPEQKLDIVAFLLKENGFRAGTRELPMDPAALKKMHLAKHEMPDEPGFQTLFNGKDFTNFKFLFGHSCTAPPGCGTTGPDAFSVKDGVILSSGRRHGYMYTEKRYLNFDLRFDYRIIPPADYTVDDEPLLNGGGFFLFLNDQRVWGRGIELEGDNDQMLYPYGIDAAIESNWNKAAAFDANKGPGPWNSVRVVSKNGKIDCYLNNVLIAHVSKHPFTEPGHLAWQYEGSTWMYRNIRIKPE